MSTRNGRIYDQQMLNTYINMYEQTIRQIDLLYDDLSQIRESIDILSGTRRRRGSRGEETPPTRSRNIVSPILTQQTPNLGMPTSNLSGWFQNLNNQPLTGVLPSFGLGNFYDSVPVAPTQIQIESATRIVPFSSVENPPNTSCPITLDIFDPNSSVTQILHCGHVFDNAAFMRWFRGHTHCPVCRYDIRLHNPFERRQEPEVSLEVQVEDVDSEDTQPQSTPNTQEQDPPRERTPQVTPQVTPQMTSQRERERLQAMVDDLPFTEEEIIQTFTNVTGNILNNLLNIPPNENPVSSDNSRYYVDASNNLVFESFMRNAFRR